MSNISINIESPVKYYDFTDQHGEVLATLKFVPSDMGIFSRYKDVEMAYSEAIDEINAMVNPSEEIMDKYEALIKEKIDYLFNADTSGFFKIASPFTPMEDGDTWGAKIMKAVIDIVQEVTGKNMEEVSKRMDSYTAKYKAGPGGYLRPVP